MVSPQACVEAGKQSIPVQEQSNNKPLCQNNKFFYLSFALLILISNCYLIFYLASSISNNTSACDVSQTSISSINESPSKKVDDLIQFTDDLSENETNNASQLRIINRREWLAQPPVKQGLSLQHPVPYVIIMHTATEKCSTQTDCIFFVRHTQAFHMESNGWWDIGQSFLVGGDSLVYTGRGWDTQGAFAYGYNNMSIGIAFIGTFIEELPVQKQMQAGLQLIQEGVRLGKISPDYKLLAHRQVSATESPGLAFYETIKKWPHWSEKP